MDLTQKTLTEQSNLIRQLCEENRALRQENRLLRRDLQDAEAVLIVSKKSPVTAKGFAKTYCVPVRG